MLKLMQILTQVQTRRIVMFQRVRIQGSDVATGSNTSYNDVTGEAA